MQPLPWDDSNTTTAVIPNSIGRFHDNIHFAPPPVAFLGCSSGLHLPYFVSRVHSSSAINSTVCWDRHKHMIELLTEERSFRKKKNQDLRGSRRYSTATPCLFVFFHPIYYLRPSFLSPSQSYLQIRGHIIGSSLPLPPPATVRASHFYREKISALSSLVDLRRLNHVMTGALSNCC